MTLRRHTLSCALHQGVSRRFTSEQSKETLKLSPSLFRSRAPKTLLADSEEVPDTTISLRPGETTQPFAGDSQESLSPSPLTRETMMNSEILDDAETWFPPVPNRQVVSGEALVEPGFSRYRMEVQYRGNAFDGWIKSTARRAEVKAKKTQRSLLRPASEAFSDALCVACDLSDVILVPAAVPEIGVHIRKLTCHVDLPQSVMMQPRVILQRAHTWMAKKGEEGGILTFSRARDDFQAKDSTTRRVYCYRILNRIAPPLFEGKGMQWHVDRHLDVEKMQGGAQIIQGCHDFRSFADPKLWQLPNVEKSTFTRTIERIEVVRQEDEIIVWIVGCSFLRHQLRTIVGVLKLCGQGEWGPRDVTLFVKSGQKQQESVKGQLVETGKVRKTFHSSLIAPRHGLTLWEVEYPRKFPRQSSLDSGGL